MAPAPAPAPLLATPPRPASPLLAVPTGTPTLSAASFADALAKPEREDELLDAPASPFRLPQATGPLFEPLTPREAAPDIDLGRDRAPAAHSSSYRNVLTQAAAGAFQIVVAADGEASLKLFRGIPDQDLRSASLDTQVPLDAFVHTQQDAIVQLSARLADGGALPSWLVFDPSTGKFSGVVPAGAPRQLAVIVEARDRDGRHAEALFRIKFARAAQPGRAGLSEQIRTSASQAYPMDALRQMQGAAPAAAHKLAA